MHQLHLSNTTYQLPSRWDELSREQVIKAAYLSSQNLDAIKLAKLLFLVMTLSLPWTKRLRLQFFYFFQANTTERADLLMLTRSFAEFTDFTAQKLKKIGGKSVPKLTWHGPNSSLANCTLWEYIKAEQYFTKYLQTKDQKWLNQLIAVLYRPARSDFHPDLHEDIRTPLIDSTVHSRALQIARLPLSERIAILMWFDGCRSFIIRSFPLVFKKDLGQDAPELNQRLKGKQKSGSWLDMITSLSANMSQFTEIANTNLSIALTDISFRIKQQKNQPRKPVTS
jgi:hypothetical protein